jgi:hypothetical protein
MSSCPTDAVLNQFLCNALPSTDAQSVELHLDECASCRRHMDELASVTALGSALAAAAKRDSTPALARAIERLEGEASSRLLSTAPSGLASELPALPPTSRTGFIGRLGGIEIRRVIGRGGMGVVYEGLDPALDRRVAVKVLSQHLLGDGKAKERFLREARAAAALADEHVVTIHAIDQSDGVQFLVLQHVAGESLAELLAREGRLPIEVVARIGAHVARGLAAAHARGLIHRDVKPHNILIEQGTGIARLTDFGLAKLAGGPSITGVGTLAGTPLYMSPEQAAAAEIDGRSDLFSLGVVMYAAATGQLPFAGDSPFVVLDQIRNHTPVPLAQIDPTLPQWFCQVVGRLLQKDPARRIQTAAELAEFLERRGARPRKRASAVYWLAGAAAVLVCIVGVAGVVSYMSRPTNPGPDPAGFGPAVEAPTGFVVVGQPDYFPTLGEAVAAANDGDVIEVHGNGPHREKKVEVRGKPLTIRAAAGNRPRIQPDAPGLQAGPQWIYSDSDLMLEGLDIIWPVTGSFASKDMAYAPATIGGGTGRLTMRNCRLVCGEKAACIATGAGDLTVERCHLVSEGAGVGWVASPGRTLRVSGSVIEAENGTVVSFLALGPRPEPAVVEFTHNTLVGKGVWGFVYPAVPKYKVRMEARNNVVRATNIVGLPTLTDASATPRTMQEIVSWTEQNNVYQRGSTYLVALRPAKPERKVLPTRLTSLSLWFDFWKATDTGSVEGDIEFHPRAARELPVPLRLLRIDKPSGSPPVLVGAGDLKFD